jgi:hypothetical protein
MIAVTRRVESGDWELTVVCLLQSACFRHWAGLAPSQGHAAVSFPVPF